MTSEDISALLFRDMIPAQQRLINGGRLVHYTSAEAASKIIKGREVWLRNSLLMNDFSEIEHGLRCLQAAWQSDAGTELANWFEDIFPNLMIELGDSFSGDTPLHRSSTFMMSLSEHPATEDDLGRLSMWRAYGGKCGVALVLKPDIFCSVTDEVKVYSAPVRYMDQDDFVSWFKSWGKHITAAESQIRGCNRSELLFLLRYAFRIFVLCTKHPGFAEEREWRIFYSPAIDGTSDWLRQENEIVAGIPQEIVKLRLMDDPARQIRGLALTSMLDRLIIGPTAHPQPVFHALFRSLLDAGIRDPAAHIRISNIPLRQ